MKKTKEDINFHLHHISKLKWSDDHENLRECIKHCEALFYMVDEDDSYRADKAFQALRFAKRASLPQPDWAILFFDDLINDTMDFPEIVSINRKNIDEMRIIRRKRDAFKRAVWLLDSGIIPSSKYNKARQLLIDLNKYWVNVGKEGTEEKPLEN